MFRVKSRSASVKKNSIIIGCYGVSVSGGQGMQILLLLQTFSEGWWRLDHGVLKTNIKISICNLHKFIYSLNYFFLLLNKLDGVYSSRCVNKFLFVCVKFEKIVFLILSNKLTFYKSDRTFETIYFSTIVWKSNTFQI